VGVGKAILAQLSRDRVMEIVERHGLLKRTEQTITDPDELCAELEEIRDAGVAFDDEEYGNGLRCVAAPVMGPKRTCARCDQRLGPLFAAARRVLSRRASRTGVKKAANIIELNIKQY